MAYQIKLRLLRSWLRVGWQIFRWRGPISLQQAENSLRQLEMQQASGSLYFINQPMPIAGCSPAGSLHTSDSK